MLTKDAAICIRSIDYSETSQIVTFFTRATGKIGAIAKGSKRPKSAFDGPIEMLSSGRIVFSHRTNQKLATLTEFQQQPTQYAIRNTQYDIGLFALNCSFFAAELVNLLTNEYDPHPELFDSFLQFLQNINEHQASRISTGRLSAENRDTLALLILFQLSLLKEIGLQPILNSCANCKTSYSAVRLGTPCGGHLTVESQATSHEIYFSSSANGLICRDCEPTFPDRIKLTKPAANCLSNLKLITDAGEKTLNEIEKVLIHHFTEILGKSPKMAKYITRGS